MLATGRADTLGAADVDDPVAHDAATRELCTFERLAGEGLHRVTPKLADLKTHVMAGSSVSSLGTHDRP